MKTAIKIAKELLSKINAEYDPIRHRHLVYAIYKSLQGVA